MAVWVVVASKHGSTREIAAAIAEELRGDGRDAQVKDAAEDDRLAMAALAGRAADAPGD